MTEPATLASLLDPEPERWGFRGDPELWQRMRAYFRETPLPADAQVLEDLVRDAFQVLTGHSLDAHEDPYVKDFDTGGLSGGRISLRFWRDGALPLLCRRLEAARRADPAPPRDRLH